MSKPAKKDVETNVSGIFSITPNPFEEGEIPGVTQLLNRKALEQEAAKKVTNLEPTRANIKTLPKAAPKQSALEQTRTDLTIPGNSNTKTNIVVPSTLQLKSFGVLFELRFHAEGKVFRYSSAQVHKEARLLPWQERIFEKMKMDKASVPADEPFQEFRSQENAFLFDAFGVQPQHFIQIVTPEYLNMRIVLVSDKSVVEHQAAIVDHYSRG